MSDLHTAGTMPERFKLNGRVLDRRSFLCALSLTAAGSLLAGRWTASAAANGGASLSLDGGAESGVWHVDDMWGHMPRYAHPIACTPVHAPIDWDAVDPVDRAWVT